MLRPTYISTPWPERYAIYLKAIRLSERVTLSDPLDKDKVFITIELENVEPSE